MSQPKAFLLTGGRLYAERVVLSEARASTDYAQRNDGSVIVPLYAPPPSPRYSKGVTTWMARFNDALALLCGSQPEPSLTEAWVAHESEDLQEWALNQCPLPWAMGIAVIEAAYHLADHPEEGVGHAPRPGSDATSSPAASESTRIHAGHPRRGNLKDALDFLDKCRADPTSRDTGALKDAHEWVERAARDMVAPTEEPE